MALESTTYDVEIELLEDMLGSTPKDKKIFSTYIASKAPTPEDAEEEIESIEELEERGWSGFPKDEEGYFLFNYAIKGYLKEAARRIKQYGNLKQLRDKVNGYCFVYPRKVRLPEIAAEPLERPLRAQTPRGERTCLARSDVIKAGTRIKFQVKVLEGSGITKGCLETILSYGEDQGLCQWRSGGYGAFKVLKLKESRS